jgi:hypothetical protein
MFDQLFARQAAVVRHQSARYAAERERFLRHLATQHYSLTSVRRAAHDLLAIVLQTDLLRRQRVSIGMIQEATRRRRSLHRGCRQRPSKHIRESLRRTATAWMAFLGKLTTDPQPVTRFAPLLRPFEAFLRDERGLALSTIQRCCRHARGLLDHLAEAGRALRCVRLEEIDSYLNMLTAARLAALITTRRCRCSPQLSAIRAESGIVSARIGGRSGGAADIRRRTAARGIGVDDGQTPLCE